MYERHLRRLRKKNIARRSALLESVANYLDRVTCQAQQRMKERQGIAWR